jgi:hypothetical protein
MAIRNISRHWGRSLKPRDFIGLTRAFLLEAFLRLRCYTLHRDGAAPASIDGAG